MASTYAIYRIGARNLHRVTPLKHYSIRNDAWKTGSNSTGSRNFGIFFFFFYYGQNIFFYSFFYSLLFLRSSIFIYEYKNSPKVTVIKIQYERYNFFFILFYFYRCKKNSDNRNISKKKKWKFLHSPILKIFTKSHDNRNTRGNKNSLLYSLLLSNI